MLYLIYFENGFADHSCENSFCAFKFLPPEHSVGGNSELKVVKTNAKYSEYWTHVLLAAYFGMPLQYGETQGERCFSGDSNMKGLDAIWR